MRSPQSVCRRERVKFGGILDVDRDVMSNGAREPEYSVWYDMLIRCSEEGRAGKPKLQSYEGCSFDESFRHYSDFYAWLHPRWSTGSNMDKDIRVRGNKIYGAETCLVVSAKLNKAFQLKSRTNDCPHGVKSRPNGKFSAMMVDIHDRPYERHFGSAEEAHAEWQRSKAKRLYHLSQFESSESQGFIVRRAQMLLSDAENGIMTVGVL